MFSSRYSQVETEPDYKEVEYLDQAEGADPHAEAEQAADVGEEVGDAEELAPLMTHEVDLVEVDVDDGQIRRDVLGFLVLGVRSWEIYFLYVQLVG